MEMARGRRLNAMMPLFAASFDLLMVFPDNHHPFALIGVEEDDTLSLKRSPNLVAGGLMHGETARGLDALKRGQRYQGLVSERLLIPTKQRAGGP
jgi:hypothetical protein